MTNAEIQLELEEIMQQLIGHGAPAPIIERLAAIKMALSRRPASPSPDSGPGEER